MERVSLRQGDHLFDQGAHGFGFGHRGDDALLQNHAGGEIPEKRVAGVDRTFEFETGYLVSHRLTPGTPARFLPDRNRKADPGRWAAGPRDGRADRCAYRATGPCSPEFP